MKRRALPAERALRAARGENLVSNSALRLARGGGAPRGWTVVAPRAALRPAATVEPRGSGSALVLRASGDPHLFGCWRGSADLEVGGWYVASVLARPEELDDPRRSILALVGKHLLLPIEERHGEILLAEVFRHGNESDGSAVELFLRAASRGGVSYRAPRVFRVPEPAWRRARIATARFGAATAGLTLQGQRRRIAAKIDAAGALAADLLLLPEFSPVVGVAESAFGSYWRAAERVPDGPLCRILAAGARRHSMHVCAGLLERRGRHLFNTAVLFDRQGRFAGQYDKTHLTIGELRDGFSCGSRYPVFDLDFGRVAVHICYDEWFPEVARRYAREGAEVLLLPVAGGKPITWRTRALDNGMHFVSASITPPSMVIESSGAILAQTHDDGVAYADLNLERREVNWYRDPTLSYGMPCILPEMRNVVEGDGDAAPR